MESYSLKNNAANNVTCNNHFAKKFPTSNGIFPEVTASLSIKLNPYFVHALYNKQFKLWINWRSTLVLYAVQDKKIVAILWLRHLRAILMILSQVSSILFLEELFGRSLFLHGFQQHHNIALVKLELYDDPIALLCIQGIILTEYLLHWCRN